MKPTMRAVYEKVVFFRRANQAEPQFLLLDARTFHELLGDADPWTFMELTNSPAPTLFGCELLLVRRPRAQTDETIVIVK